MPPQPSGPANDGSHPPVPQIQYPPANPQRQPPPYPGTSRFFKGALISIDPTSQLKTTVPFQYNPNTLRRTLKPNEVGASESDRSEAVRFTGGAVEMITVEVHLDAIDALNRSDNSVATYYGIHPLLASLELFLYPSTSQVQAYETTVSQGIIDLVPPLAPQQVFVWGPNRVLPVRLASMSVTEELFDSSLNPISATVGLEMRVLTYSDVTSDNPAYNMWMTHQQNMETMAGWVQNALHRRDMTRLLGVDVSNVQNSSQSGQTNNAQSGQVPEATPTLPNS